MINLIPPDQKKLVKQEKFRKGVLSISVSLFLFSVFVFASLFTVNEIGVNMLEKEIEIIVKEKKKVHQDEERDEKMEEFNLVFSNMANIYKDSVVFSELFEELYQILPQELYLTSFRYDGKKIILSGVSPDWENLLDVEESLKANFQDVDLSPESLVKVEDVKFLVSFSLNEKNK